MLPFGASGGGWGLRLRGFLLYLVFLVSVFLLPCQQMISEMLSCQQIISGMVLADGIDFFFFFSVRPQFLFLQPWFEEKKIKGDVRWQIAQHDV